MENIIRKWILPNWPRKVFALVAALILWMVVQQTLTATKTVCGVPVKITNLPPEKTIDGLLPNGMLNRRLTLTITGSKYVVQNLEPSDLEVVLDARYAPDEWIVQLEPKHLVSLNPDVKVAKHLWSVSNQEFVMNLKRVITEKVPVTIHVQGYIPEGYQWLDVWPEHLIQIVTGPEDRVKELRINGVETTLNLQDILPSNLDESKGSSEGLLEDVISVPVPDTMKRIFLTYPQLTSELLNDPRSQYLHVELLRKTVIPLENRIAVRAFYPLKNEKDFNPLSTPIDQNSLIQLSQGLYSFHPPIYIKNVSRLFVEVIRQFLEFIVIVEPTDEGFLKYNWQIVNPDALENQYVKLVLSRMEENDRVESPQWRLQQEEKWRNHFRFYTQNMVLCYENGDPINLDCKLIQRRIKITERNAK